MEMSDKNETFRKMNKIQMKIESVENCVLFLKERKTHCNILWPHKMQTHIRKIKTNKQTIIYINVATSTNFNHFDKTSDININET